MGEKDAGALGYAWANFPRSVLRKRASRPFVAMSRMIALLSVAWGVLPPGDFQ